MESQSVLAMSSGSKSSPHFESLRESHSKQLTARAARNESRRWRHVRKICVSTMCWFPPLLLSPSLALSFPLSSTHLWRSVWRVAELTPTLCAASLSSPSSASLSSRMLYRYEDGTSLANRWRMVANTRMCVSETCTVYCLSVCMCVCVRARKLKCLLIALSHMPEPAGRAAHARLSQANRILNESLFLCVFCYFPYNTHIWFSFDWARLVHFAYTMKWKWNERHFDSRK